MIESASSTNAILRSCDAPRIFLRAIYHATPLHYLPNIVESRQLLSAQASRGVNIRPRRTACRRDRMLGLDRYVHFALERDTPLLLDKLCHGMPHAVLIFDMETAMAESRASCALVPYNTKAWRTRSCFAPIRATDEMASLLRRHDEHGRYASAEFLVEGSLSLSSLREITVFCSRDERLVGDLLGALEPGFESMVRLHCAADYPAGDAGETVRYFERCILAQCSLPPPAIEFD